MAEGMRPAVVAQLGERIRALRQDQDLSVAALAEASAVSRRMLTQIELGQANPSVTILDRIADGLGTTFAALMGVGPDAPPEGVEVWSTDDGSWAILLDAVETPDGTVVETWKYWLLGSDQVSGGTEDPSPAMMLHVIEGALEVTTPRGTETIEVGGSGRVPRNAPYRFRAVDERGAGFLAASLMPRLSAARARGTAGSNTASPSRCSTG